VHRQTLAFYALLEEIRSEHSGLEIESCSSGGARVDLGVLECTDRVWVSDNIDPHDRQTMLRWTTQLLPPEYLGSHIASGRSHTTGRQHDLTFRAGTAVFGHLGVEWDLTIATDKEIDSLRRWISFYKQERGLLLTGDVIRMDGPDSKVLVHGVVSPDRSEAIFAQAALDSLYPDPAGASASGDSTPKRGTKWHQSLPDPHHPDWSRRNGGASRQPECTLNGRRCGQPSRTT
jgi:alpha-galactosidase